jgi:hypothetical protein
LHIYIDDLLVKLSLAGVGCYVGLHFAGALLYADDIVLLAPTPTAVRKLLAICDSNASEYDIVFNAEKVSLKNGEIFTLLCVTAASLSAVI